MCTYYYYYYFFKFNFNTQPNQLKRKKRKAHLNLNSAVSAIAFRTSDSLICLLSFLTRTPN